MAYIEKTVDVLIKVVHPFLTKSLSSKDSSRLKATGTFNYVGQEQVDIGQSSLSSDNFSQDKTAQDKAEEIQDGLKKAINDINRIQEAIAKKANHIVFRYDPELAENEAIAQAEEDIFGFASGVITYEKYVAILEFEEKINKFISHMSIENEGNFSVSA